MKYLIYQTYNYTPHLETSLEIAKKLQDEGHEVYFLICKGQLQACFGNEMHNEFSCMQCQSKIFTGLKLIGIPDSNILVLPEAKKIDRSIPIFKNLNELKGYYYEGLDIGLGVASSLVSRFRDHKFNTTEVQELINRSILTSIYVWESVNEIFRSFNPDNIIIFNGRFHEVRPLLRFCQQNKIKYYTHERGGILNRYWLIENDIPQSMAYSKLEIEYMWNSHGEGKEVLGAKFFIDRRDRVIQSWHTFTGEQERGKLPDGFDGNRYNIAIFNSSMDEYEGLSDFENKIYRDDNDGLWQIFNSFRYNENYHIYLRIHPNLKGLNNTQTKELMKIGDEFTNVTLIEANEAIDSYALLENCDKVLTFNSTIGVESIYWGKPVILLGRSIYEHLDCFYQPHSHQEAVNYIKERLKVRNKHLALKYGFWQMNLGNEFKSFVPYNVSSGKFLERNLMNTNFIKIKYYRNQFIKYVKSISYNLYSGFQWRSLFSRSN